MHRLEQLERLGKLRADGILTDEEFETQKRLLLNGGGETWWQKLNVETGWQKLSNVEPQWPFVVVPLILLFLTIIVLASSV